MPLHIDFRPDKLSDFMGNQALKESLASIIPRPDKPHAYLLVGSSGTGKTTLARILAKACGCEDIDLYEYNSANMRGIDTVRDIIDKSRLAPKGLCKFYILDEVHQATSGYQEAMLKMLEDVPKHCFFVLCTTNPEKLIATIKTRVTTFTTMPLSNSEMTQLLNSILTKLSKTIDQSVLNELVRVSEGCAREAVKLLDQILNMHSVDQQLAMIHKLAVGESEVIDLCRRLFKTDSGFAKWQEVRQLVNNLTETDPERTRRGIYGYLGKILMGTKTQQGMIWILLLQNEFKDNVFNTGKHGLINMCAQACLVEFPK